MFSHVGAAAALPTSVGGSRPVRHSVHSLRLPFIYFNIIIIIIIIIIIGTGPMRLQEEALRLCGPWPEKVKLLWTMGDNCLHLQCSWQMCFSKLIEVRFPRLMSHPVLACLCFCVVRNSGRFVGVGVEPRDM